MGKKKKSRKEDGQPVDSAFNNVECTQSDQGEGQIAPSGNSLPPSASTEAVQATPTSKMSATSNRHLSLTIMERGRDLVDEQTAIHSRIFPPERNDTADSQPLEPSQHASENNPQGSNSLMESTENPENITAASPNSNIPAGYLNRWEHLSKAPSEEALLARTSGKALSEVASNSCTSQTGMTAANMVRSTKSDIMPSAHPITGLKGLECRESSPLDRESASEFESISQADMAEDILRRISPAHSLNLDHHAQNDQCSNAGSQTRHLALRQDQSKQQDLHASNIQSGPDLDGDSSRLLSQITSAIPDLHNLITRYKETHGQLGKKAEAEQAERMKRKDDNIDFLTRQLEASTKAHEAETSKLRLQIGNLEEKHKDLEERALTASKSLRLAEDAQTDLRVRVDELQNTKDGMERDYEDEKCRLQAELKAREADFAGELRSAKQEMLARFEQQLREKTESFQGEREAMRSQFEHQGIETSARLDRINADLENMLRKNQDDLVAAVGKEQEARAQWLDEKREMQDAWERERARMENEWEQKGKSIRAEAQKEKDDVQGSWIALQARLTHKAETRVAELQRENMKVRHDRNHDQEGFERIIAELRAAAERQSLGKARLQKILENVGEASDLKSKGDAFFVDAFHALSKQIIDLASSHFVQTPARPPAEILSRVPSKYPDFLGSTQASKDLRTAYIAHVISTILDRNIFRPFLFSLGKRNEKTDNFLSNISQQLHEKYADREAVWRQHMLRTVFTSPNAKLKMNTAAGVVVDEIMYAIKYFALPSQGEVIHAAVRRIVKLCAETWRCARLERDMIVADLPSPNGASSPSRSAFPSCSLFDIPLWPEHTFDASISQGFDSSVIDRRHPNRRVLLHTIPAIIRRGNAIERANPSTPGSAFDVAVEDDDPDLVYIPGLAIYSDSPPVLARIAELERENSIQRFSPLPPEDVVPAQPLIHKLVPPAPPPPPPPPTAPLGSLYEGDTTPSAVRADRVHSKYLGRSAASPLSELSRDVEVGGGGGFVEYVSEAHTQDAHGLVGQSPRSTTNSGGGLSPNMTTRRTGPGSNANVSERLGRTGEDRFAGKIGGGRNNGGSGGSAKREPLYEPPSSAAATQKGKGMSLPRTAAATTRVGPAGTR